MERIREKIREREGAVESRERKSGQRERRNGDREGGRRARGSFFLFSPSFLPLSSSQATLRREVLSLF